MNILIRQTLLALFYFRWNQKLHKLRRLHALPDAFTPDNHAHVRLFPAIAQITTCGTIKGPEEEESRL